MFDRSNPSDDKETVAEVESLRFDPTSMYRVASSSEAAALSNRSLSRKSETKRFCRQGLEMAV